MFSFENCEKALVLLCFRYKMLKKTLVFKSFWVAGRQNCCKTIGFVMFLGLWKAKLLKSHWFYKVFGASSEEGSEKVWGAFGEHLELIWN